MSSWHRAVWVNGKKRITGAWLYNWASERFLIVLDSTDKVTGMRRRIVTDNDTPEWGNWRRVEDGEAQESKT